MKRSLGLLLALGLTVGFGVSVWAYYGKPLSISYPLLPSNSEVPGRIWAYRIPFPFEDQESVALEIRRTSTPRDDQYSMGSVHVGLVTSRQDAEMILSTGRVSSSKMSDGFSVATWVIELDDLMAAPPTPGQWRVAGNITVSGVSSPINPIENFCLGKFGSTACERAPQWNGNEICVGRFRTQDDERIYDYYCVVVASDSDTQ